MLSSDGLVKSSALSHFRWRRFVASAEGKHHAAQTGVSFASTGECLTHCLALRPGQGHQPESAILPVAPNPPPTKPPPALTMLGPPISTCSISLTVVEQLLEGRAAELSEARLEGPTHGKVPRNEFDAREIAAQKHGVVQGNEWSLDASTGRRGSPNYPSLSFERRANERRASR